MRNTCRFVVASSLVLQISLIIAAQSPSPATEGTTLAGVARELRAKRQSGSSVRLISSVSQTEAKEPQYRREIQALMAGSAFADLDTAADMARTSKERVEGGSWK